MTMNTKSFKKLAGDMPASELEHRLRQPDWIAALGANYCNQRISKIGKQREELRKLAPSDATFRNWYDDGAAYPPPRDREGASLLRRCRNYKRFADLVWHDSLVPAYYGGSTGQCYEKYLERTYGREITDKPRYFTTESDSAIAFIAVRVMQEDGHAVMVEEAAAAYDKFVLGIRPESEQHLRRQIARYVERTFRCERHPKGSEDCAVCRANRYDWKAPPEPVERPESDDDGEGPCAAASGA